MPVTVNNSPVLDYDHPVDHAYLWNDSWVRNFHKAKNVLPGADPGFFLGGLHSSLTLL